MVHCKTLLQATGIALVFSSTLPTSIATDTKDERVCDFPIIDGSNLTPEEFKEKYMDLNRPILVQNAMKHWPAMDTWTFDSIDKAFPPDTLFRVGQGPYPEKEMTMKEYLYRLSQWTPESNEECPGVFQYGQVPTSWTLWAQKDTCIPYIAMLYPRSNPIHDNADVACHLLSQIRVPEFLVGDDTVAIPPAQISHSGLLIGGPGSGIDYHEHQAAINAIVVGEKHWYMKVKKDVVQGYDKLPEDIKPHAFEECPGAMEGNLTDGELKDKCPAMYTRRHRGIGDLAKLLKTDQMTEKVDRESEYLECVQKAGEVMVIPSYTQHGVRNTKPTIAMQMQWEVAVWDNDDSRAELKLALSTLLESILE